MTDCKIVTGVHKIILFVIFAYTFLFYLKIYHSSYHIDYILHT